jgi:hypothetical protein
MKNKMKISVFLSVIAMLLAAFAIPASAKQPLTGPMDLQFNLDWPGPSETVPDWVGTITIDDDEYGMAFFNTGTGKPFAEQPAGNVFFEETWVIYYELTFTFDAVTGGLETFVPGEVAMSGYDRGITTVPNSKYHMVGDVQAADGDFADWLGRSVHMRGDIVWYPFGAPQFGPGVFRIN